MQTQSESTPRINPYKQFYGVFLPLWLLERQEISCGAKIVYACLARHAGEDGKCFPGQAYIAKEMGLSDENQKTVRKYLNELIEYKLVEKNRRGLTRSNEYFFLRHKWMNNHIKSEDTSEKSRQIMKGNNAPSGRVKKPFQEVVKMPLQESGKNPAVIEENPAFWSLREKEEENKIKRVKTTTTTRKSVVVADAEDFSSNEKIEDAEIVQKQHLLTNAGITTKKAHELAQSASLEKIQAIIAYADSVDVNNYAAFVISGLENDWNVDQRRGVKKSTRPKAEYLTFDPNRPPRELSEFEIAAKEASLRRAEEYRRKQAGRPKAEYLTFDPNRPPRELSAIEIASNEASLRMVEEYRRKQAEKQRLKKEAAEEAR